MKKKIFLALLILCGIVIAVAAYGAYALFGPNTGNGSEVKVTLPHKATYEQMKDSLRAHNVLRNERTFDRTAQWMRFKTVRPGRYTIPANCSNIELVRLLLRGQHYPVRFAFNNVRTIDQFVEKVGNRFFFTPEELATCLADSAFIGSMGFNRATLPALFIPNTYDIYYDITAKGFVERMYEFYRQFWNDQRQSQAKAIGLTPVEVATLASIVEEENHRPKEKAIIAGLYMNRLHKDMLLQADPTVKFALGDFARKRILNADLTVDSPYNTYKYRGLPPGPIRIPEGSTMDSVLHYTHHNYLYMCAKEDLSGYHNFTSSAAEHARNAARYRAALNQQHIKR